MQHHDALTRSHEVKHPCDSVGCLESHFKQALVHRAGMRRAEVWAETDHAISKMDVSRKQPGWQCENLALHSVAVILDLIEALAVKSFPGRAKPSRFSPPEAKDLSVNAIAAGSPYGLLVT